MPDYTIKHNADKTTAFITEDQSELHDLVAIGDGTNWPHEAFWVRGVRSPHEAAERIAKHTGVSVEEVKRRLLPHALDKATVL